MEDDRIRIYRPKSDQNERFLRILISLPFLLCFCKTTKIRYLSFSHSLQLSPSARKALPIKSISENIPNPVLARQPSSLSSKKELKIGTQTREKLALLLASFFRVFFFSWNDLFFGCFLLKSPCLVMDSRGEEIFWRSPERGGREKERQSCNYRGGALLNDWVVFINQI